MNRVEDYVNKHGSIIVASMEKMEIGDISHEVSSMEDGDIKDLYHPFVIVREATREEFEAQHPDIPKNVPVKYFYEARTD